MCKGSNCDRKSQLSETLTEPLNPRNAVQTSDGKNPRPTNVGQDKPRTNTNVGLVHVRPVQTLD